MLRARLSALCCRFRAPNRWLPLEYVLGSLVVFWVLQSVSWGSGWELRGLLESVGLLCAGGAVGVWWVGREGGGGTKSDEEEGGGENAGHAGGLRRLVRWEWIALRGVVRWLALGSCGVLVSSALAFGFGGTVVFGPILGGGLAPYVHNSPKALDQLAACGMQHVCVSLQRHASWGLLVGGAAVSNAVIRVKVGQTLVLRLEDDFGAPVRIFPSFSPSPLLAAKTTVLHNASTTAKAVFVRIPHATTPPPPQATDPNAIAASSLQHAINLGYADGGKGEERGRAKGRRVGRRMGMVGRGSGVGRGGEMSVIHFQGTEGRGGVGGGGERGNFGEEEVGGGQERRAIGGEELEVGKETGRWSRMDFGQDQSTLGKEGVGIGQDQDTEGRSRMEFVQAQNTLGKEELGGAEKKESLDVSNHDISPAVRGSGRLLPQVGRFGVLEGAAGRGMPSTRPPPQWSDIPFEVDLGTLGGGGVHFPEIVAGVIRVEGHGELEEVEVTPKPFPKLFHQSWRERTLSKQHAAWHGSWVGCLGQGWEHYVWTDEDNRAMIAKAVPWFLDTYDQLQRPVEKADAARYVYMFAHGGVYADLDFECLQPFDEVLHPDYDVVLGMMDAVQRRAVHAVPNAFLASRKGCGFWLEVLRNVQAKVRKYKASVAGWPSPEFVTGPDVLRYTFAKQGKKFRILIHSPETLFPVDWTRGGYCSVCPDNQYPSPQQTSESQPTKTFPFSYAVTYWDHSWG